MIQLLLIKSVKGLKALFMFQIQLIKEIYLQFMALIGLA